MDPLCHTLVGATLGCTGLQYKTAYSRVTLVVAANLPDIDVVAHFMGGTSSYAFRRGITHGVPALILLPCLLALAVIGWHRWFGKDSQSPPISPQWLLILSFIGVWSHPTLDWMNTYGMRWLMPMVNQWFYGDTLFIIDWIIWLVLAAAVLLSRFQFAKEANWYLRPASLALAFLVAYIGANANITRLAENAAVASVAETPLRLLASPVPYDFRRRELVLEYADEYLMGEYRYGESEPFRLTGRRIAKGPRQNLEQVAATRYGGWFMHWARFPYSLIETIDGEQFITVADARYVPDLSRQRLDGFAVFRLPVSEAP